MGRTVVFADSNGKYLERVQAFLAPEYAGEWRLICCRTQEDFKRQVKEEGAALALVGANWLDTLKKELRELPVLVLLEEADQRTPEGVKGVFKYQRMEDFHREISQALEKPQDYIVFHRSSKGKLVLFQSSSGGSGASIMAAACSQTLAEAGCDVLYLNLESFGTAGLYFRGEGGQSVVQFIRWIQEGKSVGEALAASVKTDRQGVKFLDSVRNVTEYEEMNRDILLRGLRQLCDLPVFDYVIVDKPYHGDRGCLRWVEAADHVVFVETGDDISNLKFARVFLGMLGGGLNKEQIETKFRLVYNRLGRGAFRELSHFQVPVLGKWEEHPNEEREELIRDIVRSGLYISEGGFEV